MATVAGSRTHGSLCAGFVLNINSAEIGPNTVATAVAIIPLINCLSVSSEELT